jgi:diguanylate cyclase (GGDEF)-like protein
VHVYCGAVSVAGLAMVAVILWGEPFNPLRLPPEFWLFAVCIVAGELRPLQIPRGESETWLTFSTPFAFAVLLTHGTGPAVLIYAAASVIGDLVGRRSWWKVLFNAAQYAMSMGAAGLVLQLTIGDGVVRDGFSAPTLAWALVAGAVYLLVNVGTTGVAVALDQRLPLVTLVGRETLTAFITAVLLAIAPILVVIAQHAPGLVPVIFAPMLVAYRTAVVAAENEHQALHDALTGLPSRALFFKHVEQALAAARRAGVVCAVMVVDLDRFKEINDTLGHHVGDQLLGEVGERLREVVGQQASVARLGGDEFGVVLRIVLERAELQSVAAAIIDALERPLTITGMRLDVGASIGSALFPDHGGDANTLIQRADIAMHAAKSGSGGHVVYSSVHDQHSPERLALVGELREAIGQGQLLLHYQPKVQLRSGRVEGVEALVRWRHPERGVVPPDEFIPLAERTGLIRPLTTVVIEQALTQCRAWHAAGFPVVVAVNLSARALQDAQLPSDVAGLLEAAGMEARWLKLELTESMIMEDRVRAVEVLDGLHAMGIGLSIDDFGTGYSSLAYLKRLPVDEIKIDKSFILNMAMDGNDALIARSTVDLGHNLGLQVVAEGVETTEVWSLLETMGCDVAQGYLISRPLPGDDLTRWLTNWASRRGAADAARPRPAGTSAGTTS